MATTFKGKEKRRKLVNTPWMVKMESLPPPPSSLPLPFLFYHSPALFCSTCHAASLPASPSICLLL
jgi:hypothetical protein